VKTEYIENEDDNVIEDDDNSTQDYEILYEDYDPILVKNQNYNEIDEYNSSENNETILPNEFDKQNNYNGRYIHINKHHQQNRNDYRNESNRNFPKLEDKYSSNRTHNKTKLINSDSSSTKRMKKSTEDMDEIDFFFLNFYKGNFEKYLQIYADNYKSNLWKQFKKLNCVVENVLIDLLIQVITFNNCYTRIFKIFITKFCLNMLVIIFCI